MADHLAAFAATLTGTSGTVAPVQDGLLSALADGFQLPAKYAITAVWAGSGDEGNGDAASGYVDTMDLSAAQLEAPSMLAAGYPAVLPIGDLNHAVPIGAASPDQAFYPLCDYALAVQDWSAGPIELKAGESLRMRATMRAASLRAFGLAWLCDRFEAVPPGQIYAIPYQNSGSTVPTSGSWTQVGLQLSQPLPAGLWGIVGLQHVQTGVLAARLQLAGSPMSPGTLAVPNVRSQVGPALATGRRGLLGKFNSYALPTLQVLAPGAGTTPVWPAPLAPFTGVLHVVKLGEGPGC